MATWKNIDCGKKQVKEWFGLRNAGLDSSWKSYILGQLFSVALTIKVCIKIAKARNFVQNTGFLKY
jgi:hypothetical protein